MSEFSSHAVPDGRIPKAIKIELLLQLDFNGGPRKKLLEIGSGSGAIAQYFASRDGGTCDVFAVDVADQRAVSDGYDFRLYDGHRLPFADETFDIVLSNHVIEHVGSREAQARHLDEIARCMAPGGRGYLATPSRWQILEPHFRLPFLSWLPIRWRDGYVRAMGRGERYDCNPMTHRELEKMLEGAGMAFLNVNVAALTAAVATQPDPGLLARTLRMLPVPLLQRVRRLSPTMVYLLAKPCQGSGENARLVQPRVEA